AEGLGVIQEDRPLERDVLEQQRDDGDPAHPMLGLETDIDPYGLPGPTVPAPPDHDSPRTDGPSSGDVSGDSAGYGPEPQRKSWPNRRLNSAFRVVGSSPTRPRQRVAAWLSQPSGQDRKVSDRQAGQRTRWPITWRAASSSALVMAPDSSKRGSRDAWVT